MVIRRIDIAILWVLCLGVFTTLMGRAQNPPPSSTGGQSNPALEAAVRELISQLPPPVHHVDALSSLAGNPAQAGQNYQEVLREKLADRWFAALLETHPTNRFAITARLPSWQTLMEFIAEHEALVDVWAYPEGARTPPRRISGSELTALKKATREQPTFITLTWRDAAAQTIRTNRVEFAFNAAERALAAARSYRRQRTMHIAMGEVLAARDENGHPSAVAQRNRLQDLVDAGRLDVYAMPEPFTDPADLFLAAEYEVDEFNSVTRVLRLYHESEIEQRVVADADGRSSQVLILKKQDWAKPREARAFKVRGLSGELEPSPRPVLGQDVVELRVVTPDQPDPRRWTLLEFGEPAVLRESALAKFSLINAHLDRHRRELGLKKANLDLIVEPLILGLNLGAGFSGLGFPAGDAGRLLYNLITPKFIADVPTVKQLRELFLVLAARDMYPELKAKPGRFLTEQDIRILEKASSKLTIEQVQDYMEHIDGDDLEAMVRIAQMGRIDAQITNLLNILTSAGKVTGVTETSEVLRYIFNNIYFSLNGDLNIKSIIAVATGHRGATPLSGVSLQDLADGNGPASAWLQYFEVSVDIRAVINTIGRIPRKTFAEKELYKPLPYALKATDLAAYEIRVFGFPLFIFYKRGLIKDDMKAYDEDYAYGIDGPNIVEHFKTKEEMDAEIRANRMWPLGYVKIPNGSGGWRDSNLAVFAHQLPSGKSKGRLVLIIYGLRAYGEHSQFIEREFQRFRQYEDALTQGAVIEKLDEAEDRQQLASVEFEPRLHVGARAADELYAPVLGGLLEARRMHRRKAWGLSTESPQEPALAATLAALSAQGIPATERDCLLDLDTYYSSFRFEKFVEGRRRVVKLTYLPSLDDIARDLNKAEEGQRIEQRRRAGISTNGSGVILINQPREVEGRREIGEPVEIKPAEPKPRSEALRESGINDGARTATSARSPLQRRLTKLGRGSGLEATSTFFFQPTSIEFGSRMEFGAPQQPEGRAPVSKSVALELASIHRIDTGARRDDLLDLDSHGRGRPRPTPPLLFASIAQSDMDPDPAAPLLLAAAEPSQNAPPASAPRTSQTPSTRPAASFSIDQFLDQIDHLPVVDRARLAFNQFASTLIDLDVDGDGVKEKVFVTVEFPLDAAIQREHKNPLTGEREWLRYRNGLWLGSVTPRRILEISYDTNGVETASHTWHNAGTATQPIKGRLIEETRTLEFWRRDLNQPGIDPYQPTIAKLRVNHVTGQIAREVYGLFPLPVTTADEQFVTETRFNPYGILASAAVCENGLTDADFQRSALDKLLKPIVGRPRQTLTSRMPAAVLALTTDLSATNYQTTVERQDLIKGTTRFLALDNANFGRLVHEEFVDTLDAGLSFNITMTPQYRDDFFFGLIPSGSNTESAPGSVRLTELTSLSYDPAARRLAANETDYTGKRTRKVWDARWEAPVEIESATRRTTNQFNRDETVMTGVTVGKSSGEELARFSGQFDSATRSWRFGNTLWFRPGITNRTEMATLSPQGRLITTRVADSFEVRPEYDANARVIGTRTFRRNPASGQFDVPHRVENDLRWANGARDAHVQTFIDGQLYDEFRSISDDEGRTRTNALKNLPGLALSTVITYDGDTERVLKSESFQNGAVRITRAPQPEVRQGDGTFHLPVRATPGWGLAATETFQIGDPLARPLSIAFENGDLSRVTAWFEGTSLPKVTERRGRSGLTTERWQIQLNAGIEAGIPFDLLVRSKLSPWGSAAVAEERALVRGTDIALFSSAASERTYFDLRRLYDQPSVTVDLTAQGGLTVNWAGQSLAHVLAVFSGEPLPAAQSGRAATEPVLLLDSMDLHGLFFHKVSSKTFDRAGNLLEERIARLPNLGDNTYSEANLRAALTQARPAKKFRHRYERGWLFETPDPATGGRMLAFTNKEPAVPGPRFTINEGAREFATQIVGIKASAEELDAAEVASSFFRTSHSLRLRESNPYMPGLSNVWTCWTITEFKPDGSKTFDSEVIFDAQGRLAISRATKATASGGIGTKILYHVSEPPPGALMSRQITARSQGLNIDLGGPPDFSGSDFVFVYCDQANQAGLQLRFSDASGRTVLVTRAPTNSAPRQIRFWPSENNSVRWLPDAAAPEQATAVAVADSLTDGSRLLLVSVHDLARTGLDVQRVGLLTLELSSEPRTTVSVSPLFRLNRGAHVVQEGDPLAHVFTERSHENGLNQFSVSAQPRTLTDELAGRREDFVLKHNGLPVAFGRMREQGRPVAELTLVDSSDSDATLPLYTLSRHDGRFLEHYKMPKWGDAQVYTVVNGFQIPKYEVFNSRLLADEASPGFVAYGYDYAVRFPLARGEGFFARALASVENRIIANTYRLTGEKGLTALGAREESERTNSFAYATLHHAATQAVDIAQLPLLAQALLPTRPLPWTNGAPIPDVRLTLDPRVLRVQLLELHVTNFPAGAAPGSGGLIPTSLTTNLQTRRYVDTVKEGGLMRLALALNETSLAHDLLGFYWHRSGSRQQPLHASYDGESRAARAADPLLPRAPYAKQTAAAQLAIAEAALGLALRTGDTQALQLGTNLVSILLREFRVNSGAAAGITESPALTNWSFFGVTLWPEAPRYSIGVNSRTYLFLKQLNAPAVRTRLGELLNGRGWLEELIVAQRQQEAWLREFVLPQVDRTGVVPQAFFQIQDVHDGTAALAPERWTATEPWLDFLLAADAMGVPRTKTRRWLENLARVHGTTVGSVWGLDWTLPLDRADAISPRLTARFLRVAETLEHSEAVAFARRNLAAMRQPAGWPLALTAATPSRPARTGDGSWLFPNSQDQTWPASLGVEGELIRSPLDAATPTTTRSRNRSFGDFGNAGRTDVAVFVSLTALFYLSILGSALFWGRFRALRGKKEPALVTGQVVPDAVMQRAEERWAKRVLGVQTPAGSENTRFSNAAVEHNFLMQLRAIYKLVLEWRRQENGWAEDDARIAEDESDDWLNGIDEFASIAGLYMRWVIKAGMKDGFDRADLLKENEDSNHIWSRLVMYFAEYYWGLLVLVEGYQNQVTDQGKAELYGQISKLLTTMGARQRPRGFDARVLFNYPANPTAMDILVLQKPGMTLEKVLLDASMKLRIPISHLTGFVERYKEFKRREQPYPIHPYIVEMAKVLPHFGLMGLGALVWYNQRIGESPIVAYLWDLFRQFAFDPMSLLWAVPLFGGLVCTVLGYITRVYRFDAPMLPRVETGMIWDHTITRLLGKQHNVMPKVRPGWEWNPNYYERASWVLRVIGFTVLGLTLLVREAPSFATFLAIKGLFAVGAFAEVASIVFPLAASALSKWLQDYVSRRPDAGNGIQFLNKLNITATRPASPLWLSIKYHTQPSVPSGGFASTAQTIVFYFLLAGVFAFVGAFLCQEMFPLWFTEKYLTGADWKLFIGSLVFWNTMYLLRYGLFLAFTGAASFLATFPIKGTFALLALVQLGLVIFGAANQNTWRAPPAIAWTLAASGLVLMFFEAPILAWWRRAFERRAEDRPGGTAAQRPPVSGKGLVDRDGAAPTLGVVYMSGDDLSHLKLTPALLMSRWTILRDKLDSDGIRLLFGLANQPSDAVLEQGFKDLYEAEIKAGSTLWNPIQLCVEGEEPRLRAELGLNLIVDSVEKRESLLTAWHLRRWLVTMMSTAGHAQDTAITLVDIAARLQRDGLAAQTVFYLVQNKYDNNDNNRPVQTPYDKGELAQRNKLTRLIKELAPGCRAYSIQNWTPFGFKAGGLTGMDLVHEETLKLTTMLVLDRNANVHDLDALMHDLSVALTDPDVVIVIPGRGTTNTLTPLGQGSQMVEEGHRSFLKGLMSLLGGQASEMVGTGWGNILACFYGRTQRAMLDPRTPKMPLTSRMKRGSSFAVRVEGLIGFTPHAVGISEDTWAVSQTAHNAMALGHRVKFMLSRAIWHKIRETWSHAEWLASFPRWSGGFLQMMHDPIMQRINDFGPASVFAKEVRANSGRNFLTAPFALFNIVLMPLAIMLDVTPFIEILVVLWNFGFVMNQILTVHGLNVYLEGSGFYRVSALLGAALAAAAAWLVPGLAPFAAGLIVGGFLAGGFIVGLGRWLYTRIRDIILFGPQLVLHALGQMVRQSLEFSVSGASPEDAKGVNMAFRTFAGPREDRPLDTFPTFINLKTIVWIVGLASVVLNLFALSNLDMLNVLLLLPSLLFSVSIFVGPFLMTPKRGTRIGSRIALAKLIGWLMTLALLTGTSILMGRGPWLAWMATLVLGVALLLLFQRALRFAWFRQRLGRASRELTRLLTAAGMEITAAGKLTPQLVAQATSDRAKLEAALTQASISAESQAPVLDLLQKRMAPLLRSPVEALTRSRLAQSRFASAVARSFILSMSILMWFFIVPVPGLFVFTARDYRISMDFSSIMTAVGCLVGIALGTFWISRVIEWVERERAGAGGLRRRIEETYRTFRAAQRTPGALSPLEVSHVGALLTDAQTYLDQRSYAHATASIKQVESSLRAGR